MTNQDQSRMNLQGETRTRSLESLENCLTRTALLFSRTLTVEEAQVWKDFLASYSSAAIEYAFENWQRNGHFFPKPAAILELIRAFHLHNRQAQPTRYEHHGEGYGEGDMLVLWKMFMKKYPKPLNRRLTEGERAQLLKELDARKAALA